MSMCMSSARSCGPRQELNRTVVATFLLHLVGYACRAGRGRHVFPIIRTTFSNLTEVTGNKEVGRSDVGVVGQRTVDSE